MRFFACRQRSFRDSVKALHSHFCRRCNIYNCRLHGGSHVRPAQLPPPTPPAQNAPPCSSSCWRLQEQRPGAAADQQLQQQQPLQPQGEAQQQQQQQQPLVQPVPAFSDYERGLLQQGMQTFGRDPCKLALLLLDRSCAQVQAYLAAVPVKPEAAEAAVGRRKAHPRVRGALVFCCALNGLYGRLHTVVRHVPHGTYLSAVVCR
jgi:hypothetical protein